MEHSRICSCLHRYRAETSGAAEQSFAHDLRILAKASDKDFELFQANLRKETLQGANISALIAEAKQQEMPAVQKVLQHLLMHTANVAMTEGNKMTIRHMGQSMNLGFGPFSSFLHDQLC